MHSCPTCQKPVTNKKRKYCSKQCHQAQTQKVECKCIRCGRGFWRYKTQLAHQEARGDRQPGRFCSSTCYHSRIKLSSNVKPIRPRDRILLAFLSYGPCGYAELARILGRSKSSVATTNQINVQMGYLSESFERSGPENLKMKRFEITELGREYLAEKGFSRLTGIS